METTTTESTTEASLDEETGEDLPEEGDSREEPAEGDLEPTIEGLDVKERVDALPESGSQATVHTVKGKHASTASQLAQKHGRTGGIDLNMYLLQQVTTIDGEQLRMKEVRDLPWKDLQVLMQAAGIVEQETTPL